uniref:Uncharacterized protein n=1 Tax=Anguilla anguilla TaxID=7936 RepID=A0A0E9VEQ8_ANGAN
MFKHNTAVFLASSECWYLLYKNIAS